MNSRFPQRDVSWRTGGPSVHAPGDGREGAYTATLFAAPSGGTCKVVIPEVSPNWETAFCSGAFTGSPGDSVLVMFDENKTPWVVSNHPVLPGHEWSYTQITSNASVVDTSESTATALIAPSAFVPDGAPMIMEFFAPFIATGTITGNFVIISLFEGATQIARVALAQSPTGAAGGANPVLARYRFTPTAASHTYKLTAFTGNVTGTPAIGAGVGGTNGYLPAFVRFVKV